MGGFTKTGSRINVAVEWNDEDIIDLSKSIINLKVIDSRKAGTNRIISEGDQEPERYGRDG